MFRASNQEEIQKKKKTNHLEQVDKMAHWKDRDTLSSEVPQNSTARPWGAK